MFFGYSVRSPHRTTKPSRGWLRVVVRKPRLVLSEYRATRNKDRRHQGPTGGGVRHPRRRFGFFGITFFRDVTCSGIFNGGLLPPTRSQPQLGLAVGCGGATPQRKNMLFCAFFHVQPKYQNDAIFVNIEGFRPCLSKPSYGASQWALMVRLMQKERPKLLAPARARVAPTRLARPQLRLSREQWAWPCERHRRA